LGVVLIDNRHITDPYTNLALEEFLVRHADCSATDYLLLYVNEPSVVLGKNQSIYREVSFDYLRSGQLKMARRISGGGTVYHDAGNLNFAFISSFADSKVNNYKLFNEPIIQALRKAGINAGMDERNNIIANGKKISGCAQFTNRRNIISHGTLLFNANLDNLRGALRDNPFKVETRAVGSVKASVMNTDTLLPQFKSVEELKQYLISELNVTRTWQLTEQEWSEVQTLRNNQYSTYEWIYGRSPVTRIEKDGVTVVVESGLLVSIETEAIPADVIAALQGVRYSYPDIQKALEENPNAFQFLNILF